MIMFISEFCLFVVVVVVVVVVVTVILNILLVRSLIDIDM